MAFLLVANAYVVTEWLSSTPQAAVLLWPIRPRRGLVNGWAGVQAGRQADQQAGLEELVEWSERASKRGKRTLRPSDRPTVRLLTYFYSRLVVVVFCCQRLDEFVRTSGEEEEKGDKKNVNFSIDMLKKSRLWNVFFILEMA